MTNPRRERTRTYRRNTEMSFKEVKICKVPYIFEETDRWGLPDGTYHIRHLVGYVDDQLWRDIQEFEQYETYGGLEEYASIGNFLKQGGSASDVKAPIMERLLKRSKGMLWQFNMATTQRLDDKDDERYYIRTYAEFNKKTLMEWEPEFDDRIKFLQTQCDLLNKKNT